MNFALFSMITSHTTFQNVLFALQGDYPKRPEFWRE